MVNLSGLMDRRAFARVAIGGLALLGGMARLPRAVSAQEGMAELGELSSVLASGVQTIDGERVWRVSGIEVGLGGTEISGPAFVMIDELPVRLDTVNGDLVNVLSGPEAHFVAEGETLIARGQDPSLVLLFGLAEPGADALGETFFESEPFMVTAGLHDTELVWVTMPGQMGTDIAGYESAWVVARGGSIAVLPEDGAATALDQGGSLIVESSFGLMNTVSESYDIIGAVVLGIRPVLEGV